MTTAAQPDPTCPKCDGQGFCVLPIGERAQARLCTCVPDCARCGGSGRVQIPAEGDRVRVGRCLCQKIPDRILLFNQAGISARYAHATFFGFMLGAGEISDAAKMDAWQVTSQWLGAFEPRAGGRGLILHGKVGTGKTHLLVGLLRQLIFTSGVRCRFIEFSGLLAMLKEGYSQGQSDNQVLDELATVPVLGIDEIGKGRTTGWELQIIDDVISRRYNAMAITLGTTNYPPQAATGAAPNNLAVRTAYAQTLGDRVGDRVHSRLCQMCDFVQIGGVDYRAISRR